MFGFLCRNNFEGGFQLYDFGWQNKIILLTLWIVVQQ